MMNTGGKIRGYEDKNLSKGLITTKLKGLKTEKSGKKFSTQDG